MCSSASSVNKPSPPSPPSSSSSSVSSMASSVRRLRCLEPATHLVNGGMETLFFRLGYVVGRHPWFTIGLCLLLIVTLGGGLFFWDEEHDSVALWSTYDSVARRNSEWVNRHFSDDVRYESVIVAAERNILRPDVLVLLAEMDLAVRNLSTADGHQWTNLCFRFGTTLKKHEHNNSPNRRRRRRHISKNDTYTSLATSVNHHPHYAASDIANGHSSPDIAEQEDEWDVGDLSKLDFSQVFADDEADYDSSLSTSGGLGGGGFLGRRAQHLVNLLAQPDDCLVRNILQIWDSDLERIKSLDQRQILADINAALLRGNDQGDPVNSLEFLLSDVRRDVNGSVYHVGATMMTWLLDNNPQNASVYTLWEKDFIHQTLHSNLTKPDDVRLYSLASSSYVEGIAEAVTSNFTVLMMGFSLIIFYFSFAMGRFNWIEQRVVLSIVGVSVVAQAILASYGLCFYLGVQYGPIHPIIPFLLLGIGVDDMFVIIQALDNLSNEEKQLPIPERMARAMKHAGVSITVTSVTDIAAFAIGATTSMPALRSFCINAMSGILMLFVLEVTFFVALTVLDERRKARHSIGCCFRPKADDWKPAPCSQRDLLKLFFERFYGPFLLRTPVKVFVLIVTAALVSVNIWGIFQLEQNFDPNWYLNEHSYPSEYFNAMRLYFPESGERASVYTGKIDYIGQRDQLNRMTELLRTNPFIHPNSVNFWYDDFQNWLNRTRQVDFPDDEPLFKELVQEYLFSPEGCHHLQDIKVEGSILDLEGNFNITGSRARFHHLSLKNASAKNKALESITSLSNAIIFGDAADLSSPIIFTHSYIEWEANRVISSELIRNLCLTMAAVVSVTLILISDLVTVFWVFTCIAFTLIDLLGLMYFWGLTVEISSSIIVIQATGLAIDYSAHIGHTFTTIRGSKSSRAKATLTRMGPAVWNGGFSTFLAFVLLVNTESHIFTTFFKLFFGVVVFGLFHGLAYLPVVLSCLGPDESGGSGSGAASGSSDSISTEFSSSPSSNSSDSSASTPIQKKQSSISALALENPIFISDIQIVCYPNLHPLDIMNGQKNNNAWKNSRAVGGLVEPPQQLQQQPPNKVPYIPQPDYTPLPTRRMDSVGQIGQRTPLGLLTAVQQSKSKTKDVGRSNSSVVILASSNIGPPADACRNTIPRVAEERRVKTAPITAIANSGPSVSIAAVEETAESQSSASLPVERVWNHPQWHSSQFLANDWSAALMKRLSVEAQSHREEKILREANKELERFESEIESYLEDVEEEEEAEETLPSASVTIDEGQDNCINTPVSWSASRPASPALALSSSPQRVYQKQEQHVSANAVAASSSFSSSVSSLERKQQNELERRKPTLTT
uniref:Patched domain-containing protein n=1 Tax=Daphnia magna TaxID=35525 RepID=A0A0P5P9V2_9CRUS